MDHVIISAFFIFLRAGNVAHASAFWDVPESAAIEWAQEEGIVEGYEDGTFRPNSLVNRAEFTKIVLMASDLDIQDDGSQQYSFSDVQSNQWYSPYLATAVRHGVISGYPDGTFRPANTVNFGEAAKIVIHTFFGPEELLYGDELWYVQYITALSRIGATPASVNGAQHKMTRGEMIEIIYRVKEYQNEKKKRQDYCTAEPEELPSGRRVFSKMPEYAHLNYLGQLFTAAECDTSDRLKEMPGVHDWLYTHMPDIAIRTNAPVKLIALLQEIGFECQEEHNGEGSCTHWSLMKAVHLTEILRLKPYADEILSDGCINCG